MKGAMCPMMKRPLDRHRNEQRPCSWHVRREQLAAEQHAFRADLRFLQRGLQEQVRQRPWALRARSRSPGVARELMMHDGGWFGTGSLLADPTRERGRRRLLRFLVQGPLAGDEAPRGVLSCCSPQDAARHMPHERCAIQVAAAPPWSRAPRSLKLVGVVTDHQHRTTSLPVVDKAGGCCGTVSLHDL